MNEAVKKFLLATAACAIGAFIALFVFSLIGGDDAAAKLKAKLMPE